MHISIDYCNILIRLSKIKIEFVLFSFSMARNRCVQNRSNSLAFILPTRIVSLRDLSHKCPIHQTQSLISIYLHGFVTILKSVSFSWIEWLSELWTIYASWRSTCFESSSNCLPKTIIGRFSLIWKEFRSLGIDFFSVFIENNMMDSLFLLGWLRSIN